MKEALRFGCQFLSLEKGSSVSLEGRGYHNSTLLQAIKCQFNSAFQHSMKSALLEGKIVKMDWELDAYLPFLFPLSRRFLQPRLFHLTLPTPFPKGCLQRSQTGKDSLLAFRQDSNPSFLSSGFWADSSFPSGPYVSKKSPHLYCMYWLPASMPADLLVTLLSS